MEILWGACLGFALGQRDVRAFALVLALKWAVNYATYLSGWPWAQMLVDLIAGAVLAVWCGSHPHRVWKDLVALGAVGTMFNHAWLVLAWQGHPGATDIHWRIGQALFTLMTAALVLPNGVDLARSAWRRVRGLDRAGRRLAPVGRPARPRIWSRTSRRR